MKSRQFEMRHIITCILLIAIITLIIVPGNAQAAGAQEAPEPAFELTSESTAALTSFGKTSPVSGATNQPTTVTLKWSSAGENPYGFNQYYKYCYHTAGENCNFLGALTTTQYEITGLTQGKTYYWQIQVINCKDSTCTGKEKTEADSGQEWTFSTVGTNPPGAFSKSMPANNDLNIASRVLSWQSSSGATSYQVCYTPDTNDTNCTYLGAWKDVGNVTTYTIPNDSKFIWGNRYYWQIRASSSGGTTMANSGTWWSFTTANLVGKVTLISPDGIINVSTPTYSWNELSGATWYYLWVIGSAGETIFSKWYEAPLICSAGTCAVTPSITLGPGNFNWKIQAWNSTGYGPWSNALSFNTPIPTAPGAPTSISPNGNIGANYSPTYTWNESPAKTESGQESTATQYQLWVGDPSGKVYSAWYQASAICSAGSCSVTPALTLKGGSHTWWVQGWNTAGYGTWSAGMSFSTTVLGTATLVSPAGDLGTNYSPNFQWNEATGATWYYLWVNGPGGKVLAKWYEASVICSAGTCTVVAPLTLGGGAHTWWVQTWNPAGYGPWSNGMGFSTTVIPLPGAATLTSPTGTIGTNTPVYTWNKVAEASWYYLWVNDTTGNIFKQWYDASVICGASTCSVTAPAPLASGSYSWWVRTWNSTGYGPWSTKLDFAIP
jgi:hypothetical protein